jgi:phosphoribosyl-dephospho-CoA transferase
MTLTVRRHELLRVHPTHWSAIAARAGVNGNLLHAWQSNDWPVMTRRYLPQDSPALIPVAVPMPPRDGCRRPGLTLQLHENDIVERVAPLPVAAGVSQAPVAWHATLHRLSELGGTLNCPAMLYGSLLWQSITQQAWLSMRSDLDVCWSVSSAAQARALVEALSDLDRDSPMRLDGELILPDGAGLSWREFAGNADQLLLKTLHGVESRARINLL